jgi:hypothetical protein
MLLHVLIPLVDHQFLVEMRGLEPLTSCMRSNLSAWEPFIYRSFKGEAQPN